MDALPIEIFRYEIISRLFDWYTCRLVSKKWKEYTTIPKISLCNLNNAKIEYLYLLDHCELLEVRHSDILKLNELIKGNSTIKTLEFYNIDIHKIRIARTKIRTVKFRRVSYSRRDMEHIMDNVSSLCMIDCKIHDYQSKFIGEYLKINTTLRKLSFVDSEISGDVNITDALCSNSTITKLNLRIRHRTLPIFCDIGKMIRTNSSITSLNLEYTDIWEQSKTISSALIANSTIRVLKLDGNTLFDNSVWDFVKVIEQNKSITKLGILDALDHTDNITIVLAALRVNSTLTNINMSDTYGDEHYEQIFATLAGHKSITKLDLGGTTKTSLSSVESIVNVLRTNTILRVLDISHVKFRYDQLACLTDVMKENKTLRRLKLGRLESYVNFEDYRISAAW